MTISETNLRGFSDLQKLLDTLPVKIEKNIMRGALRAGAVIIANEAKRLVSVESGLLRDSIRVRAGRIVDKKITYRIIAGSGKTKKTVSVDKSRSSGIKVTYGNPYYAPWVEYGTAPHYEKATTAKGLALRPNSRASSGFANRWMSWILSGVQHPGAKPHPFMRPALDSQQQAAIQAVGEYIKKRLATKEGLEAAEDVDLGVES
jgi:HK97 gp10 family phage protein